MLINVPVDRVAKSTRPGSATLISGYLHSLFVQFVGSTNQDPGFFVKPYDALLALQQLADDETEDPAGAGTGLPGLLPDGNTPRVQLGCRRPGVSIVEEDGGTSIYRCLYGLKVFDPVST